MKKWKQLLDSEIMISDHGDVDGRILSVSKRGYGSFSYYKTMYIHRVVYELFKGPIPKGFDINHLDGNKMNNHIENLEACSRSDNQLHAFRIGLNKGHSNKGEENPNYRNGAYLKLTHRQYKIAYDRAKYRGIDWKSLSVDDRLVLLKTPRRKSNGKFFSNQEQS